MADLHSTTESQAGIGSNWEPGVDLCVRHLELLLCVPPLCLQQGAHGAGASPRRADGGGAEVHLVCWVVA